MLRFPIKSKPRRTKGVLIGPGSGPKERIEFLKKLVTSLIRHERIEGRADRMHETRAYAEQIINLALQHGDRHEATMKMADEWLLEKDLVHKLFKVLAPRYQHYSTAYTSVYLLPAVYPGSGRFQAVLELKGNPYPPVIPKQRETRGLLTNVLLTAAGRDFYAAQKEVQVAGKTEQQPVSKITDSDNLNKTIDTNEKSEEVIKDHVTRDNSVESEQSSTTR